MKKIWLLSALLIGSLLLVVWFMIERSKWVKAENNYSQELQDAYNFAYENGITTMDSIDKANMDGWLNRIAMAKMLSNYAMNILWKKPANTIVPKFPDVTEKLNEDYNWAVDLAYQLWIMWIWVDKFRPNDMVTRAEFGTALSRMLFGLKDWNPYYSTHLAKLKSEWIISNDNPNLQEKRWYVMLMLMRSVKSEDNTNSNLPSNTETMETNTISLKVGNEILTIELENNSSTKAFVEKLKQWDIIVNAKEYWNFEKVWDLGFSLPREDKQITTKAWDIVLYNWNQISLFYESNSRSYTKLWKVQNKSQSELKKILWDWNVTLTFSLDTSKVVEETNKSLILVFSPTGNTKRIATFINEIEDSDLIELIPEIPYTAEDLDWNSDCRANREQNDDTARPWLATEVNLDGYDRIYLWYPIWWWTNPKLILTLIEKYDFSGKEVVLFCTSGSSWIETSETALKWKWLNVIWSKRFSASSSKQEVENWLNSL